MWCMSQSSPQFRQITSMVFSSVGPGGAASTPSPAQRLFIPEAGSVFLRKQQRRHRPVRLRHNPEFGASRGVVDRQEPAALAEGAVILRPVLAANVSPIAPDMVVEGGGESGFGQGRKSPRRRDHL